MKSTIISLMMLLLCSGCNVRRPSEATAYRIACEELANDQSLSSSEPKPALFEEASLHIAKNAGCVILPYQFTNEKGETESSSYTVWLKRVERKWLAERSYVTTTYSDATP